MAARDRLRTAGPDPVVDGAQAGVGLRTGGAAAVPDVVEEPGRRAQVVGHRRQRGAGLGGRLVGGAAGPLVEHRALLEGPDDGAQPLAHRLGPLARGGVRVGGGAVLGGGAGPAGEQRPARVALAAPSGPTLSRTATTATTTSSRTTTTRPAYPPGEAPATPSSRSADLLQQPAHQPLDQARTGVLVDLLGQLLAGQLGGLVPAELDRDGSDHRAYCGTTAAITGAAPATLPVRPRRPGPARGRAPRAASAGRRRAGRSRRR